MAFDESAQACALELPYELISKIFLHCLPLHRRIRPCRGCVSLRLSQICGQWREVALTTPELWSSVYLEFTARRPYDGLSMLFDGVDPEPDPDHTYDVLELWFTRAAGYPLSVTMICNDLRVGIPPRLIDLVALHSAQWGRVEIQVTAEDFRAFVEIPGPFPRLRSLAIRTIAPMAHRLQLPAVNLLQRASNLMAVNFPPTWMTSGQLGVLPASLTALQNVYWRTGDNLSYSSFFEQLPHLRQLGTTADFPAMIDMQSGGAPLVVLPVLQSLITDSTFLLDFIDAQALDFLGVRSHPSLAAFLSRSAGQLTCLSIDIASWHIGGAVLTESLAEVPALITLDLSFPNERAGPTRYAFLERADLLPRLRRLVITDLLHRDMSAPFLAVVRARPALTHAELHLRSRHAHLHFSPPARDILRELEALVARGTNIRITAPNFAWPLYSRDEDVAGILDFHVFTLRSCLSTPHAFSPFP
ncbi:hypothetical protein B0H11DRAFT_63294 [Mycena galericulata]|nr:hypothetical protein B0H11DRAFT_63294 [Mycena galericulata]